MADERIGKTYEALIKVALDRLQSQGKIHTCIFWNETPVGIAVEPDFLLGGNKDVPDAIISVTHSNAPKKSPMKCWRNIGEVSEAKVYLQKIPMAYNIVFDSVIEENLKKLQGAIFDGQLIIGDKAYGNFLQKWVAENDSLMPKNQEEKVIYIVKQSLQNEILDRHIVQLSQDLDWLLTKKSNSLNSLWTLERVRPKTQPPECHPTTLRRGLSKLLVFPDRKMGIDLYRGKKVDSRKLPACIFYTGLAVKTLAGAKPADLEVRSAIDMLSDEEINCICDTLSHNQVVNSWLAQIRNASNLEVMLEYICSHYSDLCNFRHLAKAFRSLHDNPNALVPRNNNDTWPPATVWLFDMILEIIKKDTGKANGYGHAKLGAEVAATKKLEEMFSMETTHFLLSPWGHLSDWACRVDCQKMPSDVITCFSYVLSEHLKRIGILKIRDYAKTIPESVTRNTIETKLCSYNGFYPLPDLLQCRMPNFHVKENLVRYQSCFAEMAGLSGRVGETTVAQVKDCIINWQSAYEGHPADKTKELCGRAVGLRYTWDKKTASFTKRPGVNRLILLLDGAWTQKHLNSLVRAGWDEIYYPDEIDKLKASVLGSVTAETPERPTEEEADFPEAAEKTKPYGRTKARKL